MRPPAVVFPTSVIITAAACPRDWPGAPQTAEAAERVLFADPPAAWSLSGDGRRLFVHGRQQLQFLALAPDSPASRQLAVEAYHDVAGTRVEYQGREALALELTPEEQQLQLAGAGGNRATFARLQGEFQDGVIEVDVAAELNGRGGPDARAFIGVVFHLADDERFEAVYLRMLNGSLNRPLPPAPRDVRAIQYIAHPDFHFPVSRAEAPGVYEKGAPVAEGRWHRLRLEINGTRLVARIDGEAVLELDDLRLVRRGQIGLWVGDGTRAYFSDLRIEAAVAGP